MASDSSASTSPMVLTPDSTGSSPDARKARRQTAFYPNLNAGSKQVKPFSRSAAKRESVMALGSIEHLQHYFTKAGIASKKNPLEKAQYGLVPAIGGKGHVPSTPSAGTLAEFNLPPSPTAPSPPRQALERHVKSDEIDPDSLLPGVCEDLSSVAHAWQLDRATDSSAQLVDILDALKATTRAIRSVRNYLLSLPDESAGTIRANFRAAVLGPGRPHTSSIPRNRSDPLTRIRRSALEVLATLRIVEEKCRLPLSDEAYDAQSDGGGSRGDSQSRFTSPNCPPEELPPEEPRGPTPDILKVEADVSFTYSLVQVNGRYQQVPVWEEEEDVFQVQEEEEKEKRERWDERLVLAGGWLYRQDIQLADLEKERGIVSGYLDIVDEVLFEAQPGVERGWEHERRKYEVRSSSQPKSKNRRVSAGDGEGQAFGGFLGPHDGGKRRVSTGMVDMLQSMSLAEEPENMAYIAEDDEPEETIEDDLLPDWARRTSFVDDDLGRAHAILSHFLPRDHLSALQSPDSPSAFLDNLSSGQLLCIAYNSIVRKSKKPWGYISKDGIHDIIALEKAVEEEAKEGSRKGWTFRRTDNLRLWVGALKLRYLLPVQVPSQVIKPNVGFGLPSAPSAPAISRQAAPSTSESFVFFDSKVVARKEGGWQDMLKTVLVLWIQKVVDERRLYQ
ncbi:hypothetical protein P691DRAFT_807536 [Macrolepiota fuliginosa MF-IS2]|uniref:Uncharacterized protein n=1 Tax=Macrolepiota fuliginosa MF-IS2 TaxID=1400762 RepID=A0A9P5X7Q2_9AGAR|nr:hypothetical protein P691DRAFT_807536 [Macrolepiota fuliginosa MF-IS2]